MQELKFLFWNTNKNKCLDELYNISNIYKIDIFILAENPATSAELVLNFNRNRPDYYPQSPISQCKKVTIITRFHQKYITPVHETNRITIRKVKTPLIKEFLLVGVHLGDKMSNSPESQSEICNILKREIEKAEKDNKIIDTIITGDFNMNPFESGIVNANGLHATMSKKLAQEGGRIIDSEEYGFFYNPMWNLFGDLNKPNSGSYFYRKAELLCYHWNIFDQVLIRPSLINFFDDSQFSIMDNDGIKTLLNVRSQPDKKYSDHLPLLFTIKFKI